MVIFPQNGRVVIIDNDILEAQPLMKVFSKNKIRFSYFSGDKDQVPVENFQDIRFLFIDLQLVKGEHNPSVVAGTICSLLEKIVSTNNCPYVLIIWSKQKNLFYEQFVATLNRDSKIKKPLDFIDIEKSEYFRPGEGGNWELNDDEEKILASIERKIIEKLSSNDPFHLFTYWDNLVYNSSNEIITIFSSLIDSSEKPDKKMWAMICALAEANAGKNLDFNDGNEVIQNALFTYNGLLLDTLEKNINTNHYPIDPPKFSRGIISDDDFSPEINSRLLLDKNCVKFSPGNVYKSDQENLKKKILQNCFDSNKLHEDFIEHFAEKHHISAKDAKIQLFNEKGKIKSKFYMDMQRFHDCCVENFFSLQSDLIFCEVSPICDFTQQKLEMNRIVYGLKIPGKYIEYLKNTIYFYESPMFNDEKGYYKLLFDFRFFGSIESTEISKKEPILRIRHELLVDIQAKIAHHVNRPGIISLPDIKL